MTITRMDTASVAAVGARARGWRGEVAGRVAEFVAIPPAPPLGALPDVARTATSIDVPNGATLLLYTDGLVEDPNQPIDDGLRKLRSAVRTDDPAIVCHTVMHHLIGNRPPPTTSPC